MTDLRPSRVDTARLLPVLGSVVIVALVASVGTVMPSAAAVAVGAVAGALGGLAVFAARSGRGLGQSLTAEREPAAAGTINIASIPVIGVGGLGLVAMAAFVAWYLPRGQDFVSLALAGGAAGAAAAIVWRRARGESPFAPDPGETLHLR